MNIFVLIPAGGSGLRLGAAEKKQFLTLLLSLCALPGASITQAQSADAVGAWGYND